MTGQLAVKGGNPVQSNGFLPRRKTFLNLSASSWSNWVGVWPYARLLNGVKENG